ncbi:MAG: OmpA family protein [Anditalea sp.]
MKNLMALLLLLGIQVNAFSQLEPYQWRVGISGGYANYYGDLSPYPISSIRDHKDIFRLFNYNKNHIHDYSYAISLEKRLTASVGLQFSVGKYSISMSDRYVNPNNILQLDAPNFERALNFKTEILDYGIGLVMRTDNGELLNKNAFMAPYLTFGMGWANFKVFGDLYDENNNPYNYTTFSPINDGDFETRLDNLYTELPEGYTDNSFYSNLGVGLRFRIGKKLELFAQSDFKHAFTDYLDDVSGLYRVQYDSPEQQYAALPGGAPIDWENPFRGNSNGRKDWYIFHSIGIKLSFSPMKSTFTASRISPGRHTQLKDIPAEDDQSSEHSDSLSSVDEKMEAGNNYFTFIQLNQPYNRDSSYYSFKILESDVSLLNLENQQMDNENLLDSLNSQLDSLQSMQERITLASPNNELNAQPLVTVEKDVEAVEKQLEEALLKRKKIEAGLMTARQNKELYQTAYILSQERQGHSDSLGFVNEILQLPDAVRKALAQPGSFFKIDQDSTGNSQLFSSSGVRKDGIYNGEEQDFRSATENDVVGIYPNQKNQLYAELMQERAKNNYLLRELGNYSNPSFNQRAEGELFDYYERRNNSQPDISYRIDDYNEFQRRNRSTGYVLPLVVPPNNNAPTRRSEQKFIPGNENIITIPRQLEISPDLPRLTDSGLPSYFPQTRRRNNSNFTDFSVERNMETIDTASLEKKAFNLPINSKVEIYFDNNQAKPGQQELNKLLPLATILKNNPTVKLTISGFADNTGYLGYNLNLINERISNVKTFLIEKSGISPERIIILSGGLIVRGKGQNSSPKDRKVEVWIQEK